MSAINSDFEKTWTPPSGLRGWASIVNNNILGKRFMITSGLFFLFAGLMALLIRVQLAVSNNAFLPPDAYNKLFTMHGSTMMYLFAVPFLEGLAVYIMPMMIGSRDLAFPRLSAFSYWAYLFGGLIFFASFFFGTVPDAGWFSYTPLSGAKYSGLGLDFWVMGLSLVELSGIATGLEIVVTILKFRAMGMSLNRMPLMVWTLLVAGVMIIFAFTTLLTATLMLELDRTAGTHFFSPEMGGSSLLWQHLFWFFGHPEVYIIFLPATGIVSTLVVAFARRPMVAYVYVAMAVVITGFVSFSLWAHHMFTTGMPELAASFFTAASLTIAVATGVQVFAWIATLWGSRPKFHAPMLYLTGFFLIFVLGGMTGVMLAVAPLDWQIHDTFFVVAHFHYVLIGGAVFPLLGGLYYWLPKITGKNLSPLLGKLGFWLSFIGFNLTFFPMHIMGLLGMPRRVYTYPKELGLDGYNLAATAGAFVFAAGIFVFVVDAIWSALKGERVSENPWGAGTLEWSVPPNPPPHSFDTPPVATSQNPLWGDDEPSPERLRVQKAMSRAPALWRAQLVTDALKGRPQAIQWLPGPTLIPFHTALALFIVFSAVLMKFYLLSLAGAVYFAVNLCRWLWQGAVFRKRPGIEELEKAANLTAQASGAQSTTWWGALGFVAICSSSFGALFFSYAYTWLYSEQWPQNGLSLPAFELPLAGTLVLLAGALAQGFAGRFARKARRGSARWMLLTAAVSGALYFLLQILGLAWQDFTHQTNAYGSLHFLIQGLMAASVLLASALNIGLLLKIQFHLRRWQKTLPMFKIVEMLYGFNTAMAVAVALLLYLTPRILL